MSKLKMNQCVPNKSTDLLKKNQLNGNSVSTLSVLSDLRVNRTAIT